MAAGLGALCVGAAPASAGELPGLRDDPWFEWYAGWEARGFRFGVNRDGEGVLMPLDGKGEPLHRRVFIKIAPMIEEIRDGKTVQRLGKEGEWEAVTPEAVDPEVITYRGMTVGEAKFEVSFRVDGKTVVAAGRLLEKGRLEKNPVRFALRTIVPNVYYSKKDPEALEDIAKRDRIEMRRGNRSKERFESLDKVLLEKVNDGGFKEISIDLKGYKGSKVELVATDESLIEAWNKKEDALYKGMRFFWKAGEEGVTETPSGRLELSFK